MVVTGTAIILSIKKRFLDLIENGEKKWEYRKIIPTQSISYLIFYCPEEKAILNISKVGKILVDSPQTVVAQTHKESGVREAGLLSYLEGREKCVAYQILDFFKLDPIFKKEEIQKRYPGFKGPQSFMYLEKNHALYKYLNQLMEG